MKCSKHKINVLLKISFSYIKKSGFLGLVAISIVTFQNYKYIFILCKTMILLTKLCLS